MQLKEFFSELLMNDRRKFNEIAAEKIDLTEKKNGRGNASRLTHAPDR